LEKLSQFALEYRRTGDKVDPIYKLFADQEIVDYLKSKGIDSFMLPLNDEISATTFQETMFNVNKKINNISKKKDDLK